MVEQSRPAGTTNHRTRSQREQMQGAAAAENMKPTASGDSADQNPLAMSNRKPEKNDQGEIKIKYTHSAKSLPSENS